MKIPEDIKRQMKMAHDIWANKALDALLDKPGPTKTRTEIDAYKEQINSLGIVPWDAACGAMYECLIKRHEHELDSMRGHMLCPDK